MTTQTIEKILILASCLAAVISAVIMCRQELRAMAELQTKEALVSTQPLN